MSELKELIKAYKKSMINISYSDIKKLELGIYENNNNIIVFGILINCVENIIIFNERQKDNVLGMINALNNSIS